MDSEELAKNLLKKLEEENSWLVDQYFSFDDCNSENTMLLYIALRKFTE